MVDYYSVFPKQIPSQVSGNGAQSKEAKPKAVGSGVGITKLVK